MSQTIGPVTSQKGPVCLAGGFGPVYGPGTPAFVLDQLSAFPAVAFSVRQLTANPLYARPYCMLVRRSSDNATLNIGYVNGLLDTVSLLAFVGSGNGYVVTWYNQGSLGSVADATQATAASQPQIVASGVVEMQNGVPALVFAANLVLKTASTVTIATGTAYSSLTSVCAPGNVTGTKYVTGFGTQGTAHEVRSIGTSSANAIADVNSVTATSSTSLTANQSIILTGLFGPGTGSNNIQVALNGTVAGQATDASLNTVSGFMAVGGRGNAGSTWVGSVQEVVSLTSLSDLYIYEPNAAAFYGISGVTK